MKRILFPALIAGLALLFGAGAVACGDDDDDGAATDAPATDAPDGDGELTLEAYLTEVNDIEDGVTIATDDIGDRSEQAFSDPPQARQSLSAAADVGESAVASLQALTPPAEAQDQHDALIAAGEDLVAAVSDLSAAAQGLQAGAAFDTFAADAQAADSELSQAINALSAACDDMQQLATDNSVDITLECPVPVT